MDRFAALLGRLSVSRKLLLIYLLDLTAVIFITSILIEEKFIAIDFARKELAGNTYIVSVREALFGTVAVHDGGDKAPLSGLRVGVRQAEQVHGQGMAAAELAGTIETALEALAGSAQTVVASHKAFQSGRQLLTRIGDQSNLILDPDLDSYYTMSLTVLRFPELLEQLLNYRSLPAGSDKTQFLISQGRLAALREGIEADYRAAYAGNPAHTLMARLDATRAQLLASLDALLAAEAYAAAPLRVARLQAIEATHAAWQATSASLDELLRARVDLLFQRMWLHLSMAAALLALILFLVFFVARLIALPLRRLAQVADRVQATNDYTLRATWDSGDEIGQLVTGFNNMLARLDRERIVQQELTAQARAAAAQQELIEAIPIPLLVTSVPEHRVLHTNAPAAAWVDAAREDPWGIGLDRSARARFFQRLADEGAAQEFEVRWTGPCGSAWALLSAARLRYQGQDAVLTTFAPINTIKRLEARLRLWATIFEATSEGILVIDRQNIILLANTALARATGYRIDEMLGRDPEFLHAPSAGDEAHPGLLERVAEAGSWQGEFLLRKKNGAVTPHWLVLNTVRDELGEASHIIALLVDISERKAQEEKIRHLAHHDALTGLPNRLLFDERLRMSLQQADRHHERVALLFIDLDRFKNINDSLGHHVGDGLLQSVAGRLTEAVRAGDTVCRQGGDEFVIILNAVEDVQEVAHVVERRLIPLVLQTHQVCDVALHISCSVGIAIYPDDAADMETLMRHADSAMYSAKASGRNNFQFFSAEMNRDAVERLNIETHLQSALENRELELHVQPIVDCRSGALVSVEALMRWRQPALGMIPPTKFISIAEENGQIHEIGRWALVEACRLHQYWVEEGLGRLPIAVNVSAVQFRRGDFVDTVRTVLAESGMPAEFLQLELTESLMMTESERNLADIQGLKALGVGLSLDDFGTGYSSLSYLHRLPLDKLKIDRSFVRDMIDDPADMAITRAIVNLGGTLGLRVVAEGVEHAEELKALRELGCDEVQGYLFSPPLPAHELAAWLDEFRAAPWVGAAAVV
ncbi:MAG: EAL domain-containing protein [Rhodocyclaceae bacterium]|nr:EAL domain-containing protein [Rhodocyclaceae bacterium]MDZ4213198.1 EAL domain-containing protein [Rhodocyclaceae bacterium]